MIETANRQIPEPRVLAKPLPLSGLLKLVGNKKAVIWIEYKCGGECEVKIFSHVKKVKNWGAMAAFTDGETMMLESYGKTWRAWFLREPTDVERKAAPEWKV